MAIMNRHSPHSPNSLSAPDFVAVTNSNSITMPSNVNVQADHNFPERLFENNASDSSTEDDSSHTSMGCASFINNDSDCETIVTISRKTKNENREINLGVDCKTPSENTFCSSGTVASFNSMICKGKAVRTNDANPIDVDKMILEELQGLSVVDRGLVQEEIHGVRSCAVDENDEKIVEGLKSLEEEIRSIRQEISATSDRISRSGNAYDESIWSYLDVEEETISAPMTSTTSKIRSLYSYIFHRDFRLKFLRADLYNAGKAAHRYLRCVECLLKYFGSYALQRPLMYEDLGKECHDAAKAGYIQILPSRDRAGRLVVVSLSATDKSTETTMAIVIKLFSYVFQVVSEDIETQKRGVIFVFSTNENALDIISSPSNKIEYTMYREGSPVRRSCTHFCLPENNPKMRIVRAAMMLAMPREERVRTRIHMDGLTTETQYKLMTFGIPASELPITSTGAIKTKQHMQWIKTRKAIDAARMKSLEECCNNKMQRHQRQQEQNEQEQPTSQQMLYADLPMYAPTFDDFLNHHGKEPIMYPMINDVLFSKGGKNVAHYGNIEFTDLMKRSLLEYVSGTQVQNRKTRKAIRQTIVDEVQARGGRFLALDKKIPGGCCWTEIERGPDLHDRIATSLYDHKRRLAAKLKVKTNRCGTAMFAGIDNSKRRKVVTDDGEPISHSSFCGYGHV